MVMLGVVMVMVMGVSPATAGSDPVEIVPGKQKDVFVIKADKTFVGAKIEIFFSNGDVVTRQVLKKRKLVVDFSHVKTGEYVIRVSKDGLTEEFEYRKI